MAAQLPEYPWFGVIDGDDIEQGDILEGLPRLSAAGGSGRWRGTSQRYLRMERAGPHCDVAKLRPRQRSGEG